MLFKRFPNKLNILALLGEKQMSNGYLSQILFRELINSVGATVPNDTDYPRYNVLEKDENITVLELAVAGFKKEELTVKQEFKNSTIKQVLTIEGKKEEKKEYAYKGISTRDFKREFSLPEYTEIKEVTLIDGILSVVLEKQIPEDKKPKTFTIN
jgi:molecular chaperone IbpA